MAFGRSMAVEVLNGFVWSGRYSGAMPLSDYYNYTEELASGKFRFTDLHSRVISHLNENSDIVYENGDVNPDYDGSIYLQEYVQNWWSMKGQAKPQARALNLSKQYKGETVRYTETDGYSKLSVKEWYYKNGEMICHRFTSKDNGLWKGDPLPEFEMLPEMRVEDFEFDVVERQVKFVERQPVYSNIVRRYRFTGRDWSVKHNRVRVTLPDGSYEYYINGQPEMQSGYDSWLEGCMANMEYRDSLIIPNDLRVGYGHEDYEVLNHDVKFHLSMFQRPNLQYFVDTVSTFAKNMDAYSRYAQNDVETMKQLAEFTRMYEQWVKGYLNGKMDN